MKDVFRGNREYTRTHRRSEGLWATSWARLLVQLTAKWPSERPWVTEFVRREAPLLGRWGTDTTSVAAGGDDGDNPRVGESEQNNEVLFTLNNATGGDRGPRGTKAMAQSELPNIPPGAQELVTESTNLGSSSAGRRGPIHRSTYRTTRGSIARTRRTRRRRGKARPCKDTRRKRCLHACRSAPPPRPTDRSRRTNTCQERRARDIAWASP